MKNMWTKIKKHWEARTSPDKPILTGKAVNFFVLRTLLAVLSFVLIDKFIVSITLMQYVIIDVIFELARYVVKLMGGK